jgi:hypothetical protein
MNNPIEKNKIIPDIACLRGYQAVGGNRNGWNPAGVRSRPLA